MVLASTRIALVALGLAALGLAALAGCGERGGQTRHPTSGTSTTAAKAGGYADLGITLADLDDEEVAIVSATADDLHVLVFWGTYCLPCIGQLANLQGVYDRLGPEGVHVYAISVDGPDTIARVPGVAAREGWTFPVLFDPDTAVMSRWNPKGDCPFYVVLNAEGHVLETHQGYVKGDVAALESFLGEQLAAR